MPLVMPARRLVITSRVSVLPLVRAFCFGETTVPAFRPSTTPRPHPPGPSAPPLASPIRKQPVLGTDIPRSRRVPKVKVYTALSTPDRAMCGCKPGQPPSTYYNCSLGTFAVRPRHEARLSIRFVLSTRGEDHAPLLLPRSGNFERVPPGVLVWFRRFNYFWGWRRKWEFRWG